MSLQVPSFPLGPFASLGIAPGYRGGYKPRLADLVVPVVTCDDFPQFHVFANKAAGANRATILLRNQSARDFLRIRRAQAWATGACQITAAVVLTASYAGWAATGGEFDKRRGVAGSGVGFVGTLDTALALTFTVRLPVTAANQIVDLPVAGLVVPPGSSFGVAEGTGALGVTANIEWDEFAGA